jgi:hypothetical protein
MTLTASGGINYTWTPGGQTLNPIVVAPPTATNYFLTGDNSFNCSTTIQVPVIVYPNPTYTAAANRTLVCVGGPSTLSAGPVNTYTYSWTTGATTHTSIVNPLVTTVYTVTGVNPNTGCNTVKTVTVQAYTPVTAINGPTAVCIGSSITLQSAPANSYTWTLNGFLLGNGPSIVVGPTLNTTYLLGTTSTSNGVSCVGGNSTTIQANALPIITANSTRTLICIGEPAYLTGGGGVSYDWMFVGSGSLVTVYPPAQAQTIYTVEGTDANGCKNIATITIKVSACIGIEESNKEVTGLSAYPNPSNGSFSISAKQPMSLELINELGQVVQEIRLDAGNNYTIQVKDLAEGMYFLKTEKQQTYKLLIQ